MAHGRDIVYHLFITLMIDLIRHKDIERPFDASRKMMEPIDDRDFWYVQTESEETCFICYKQGGE